MNMAMRDRLHPGVVNAASTETGRSDKLAAYVAGGRERDFPAEIIAEARVALIDFMGVAIGAVDEPAAKATRAVAQAWKVAGKAPIFCGPTTNAAMAALVNGTTAHCMDYDDTHLWGGGHIGAPCWSTALAVACDRDQDETAALAGFITGFEVMARLGGGGIRGIGRSMQQRGFHPTGVNGLVGAAATAAVIMDLDQAQSANALSAAATSAGGLVASFGSDSKPFHAGRAAMNGILAAELAAVGFRASPTVFDRKKGMLDAFIQDGSAEVPDLDFDYGWELLNNGYKPFACCRATHASIQAAHQLTERVGDRKVRSVRAKVHANAPFTAGKRDPQTPLDCKFSVPFCIAMALRGYRGTEADFSLERLNDPAIRQIVPLVELLPQAEQPQYEAYLEVEMEDGERLMAETKMFLGHPDNPMSASDHRAKFLSLTVPVLGERKAEELLAVLEQFDQPGALAASMKLVSANT